MRKPLGILGSMAKRAQSNATRNAKKAVYTAMWGEPPKQKRSSKKRDK